MTPPILTLSRVEVADRLEPMDLEIEGRCLVALVGPNGSGKTSLLRAIAGIEPEHCQGVTINGERLGGAPPARRMKLLSFLPASRTTHWPIPVSDLIALGMPDLDPARIEELVVGLELQDLVARPVDRLSTGERSRVLLARALAARPRLLLLDEPLSNLDPYWVIRTIDLVRSEIEHNGSSAVVSLHDLSQVERFDRLLLLDRGRLVADGVPSGVVGGDRLQQAFRIRRDGSGWSVRQLEDRQSSP